jgi:hypothetical protein
MDNNSSTTSSLPSVGDLVVVTYESEIYDCTQTEKGQVKEVDDDPDHEGWDYWFAWDEPNSNTEIQVVSGTFEGEPFTTVSRTSPFSGGTRLGTDATFEVVG